MPRLVSLLAVFALAAPAPAADVVFNPGRHPMPQVGVLLTPDGKTILTVGSDRCVRLWDVETGKPVAELWLPTGAGWFSSGHYSQPPVWVSPDSKVLAVPFRTSEVPFAKFAILPLSGAGRGTYRVAGGQDWGEVDGAAFSPDGKLIATTAERSDIGVWEVATGKKVCAIKFDPDMRPRGMFFSPDGKTLTVALPMTNFNGGKHSGISTFDATTGKFLGEIAWKEGGIENLGHPRLSPDGKTLAVKRLAMQLMSPDGTNARAIPRPDGMTFPAAGEFDSRGRFLVAWRKGEEYTVRDELGGKEVARFTAAGGQVQFSADGSRALTADGGDVTLHDLTGRGQTKTIRVAEPAVSALAWAEGPKLGIGFGPPDSKNAGALTAAFDLSKFALAKPEAKDYTRARKEWDGVKLLDSGYHAKTTVGGKEIKLDYEMEFDWEDIKAATLVGPGHAVMFTGKGTFGYDTKTGREVTHYPDAGGWALVPSRGGEFFATHRAWPAIGVFRPRASDPALTLYVAGGEWVAWTPNGAWDSSPNGARLAGTLSKEEPGKLRTFVPLPKEKNDPDAVKKALK